ncbi:MAG: tRNA (adenine(22)-N(1))-methyltransferase [Wujia sp.]
MNKKIRLSRRMQALVQMLLDEKDLPVGTVADIGCDHAFVSMACIDKKIANHVIAMDVGVQPLKIAQSNIREYGYEQVIETRLSDGFMALQPKEADWAILAGMGGALMRRILQQGSCHLEEGVKLILQPQSEPELVRIFLEQVGYQIIDEEMLVEDGKYYTIIKAKKGAMTCDDIQRRFGPVLLKKKHPVLRQFLSDEYEKNKQLKTRLQSSQTQAAKKRRKEIEVELSIIEAAMQDK